MLSPKLMQALGKPERLEGVTNTDGQVEDEDMQILSVDRSIFADSADRVTEMFQNTPAFSGISGAADLFQAPAIASIVSVAGPDEFEGTPILEPPEIEIPTTYKASKKSVREGELLMRKMIRLNT